MANKRKRVGTRAENRVVQGLRTVMPKPLVLRTSPGTPYDIICPVGYVEVKCRAKWRVDAWTGKLRDITPYWYLVLGLPDMRTKLARQLGMVVVTSMQTYTGLLGGQLPEHEVQCVTPSKLGNVDGWPVRYVSSDGEHQVVMKFDQLLALIDRRAAWLDTRAVWV